MEDQIIKFVPIETFDNDNVLLIEDDQIPIYYRNFKKVFSKSLANNLPLHSEFDHEIELTGDIPKKQVVYSTSPLQDKYLKEYLEEHLDKGLIRYSKSPFGAPILFIMKKDQSLRPLIDYKSLNFKTKKVSFPFHIINSILNRLLNVKI